MILDNTTDYPNNLKEHHISQISKASSSDFSDLG